MCAMYSSHRVMDCMVSRGLSLSRVTTIVSQLGSTIKALAGRSSEGNGQRVAVVDLSP